ncbi:MAG: uroporphyrinogen-III C-methyltransferase [Clostridium sp.]
MNGKVYIIGTGPGDEELLTLKAVRVLQKCTAVLYDRLVSNNILNYLSDKCEVYYCGKEPGAHYKTQEEINNMLIKLSKDGHTVGRIKGGDPFVFGRGGEECLALKENNITFEVIPGVTSPIAVLNYAGIPVTQRGVSQSFHVITGMSAGVLNVNFEALANENGTLIFMMGLDNLENIVKNLIINGKDSNTPCGVVMRGTSAKQRKVIGTLENITNKVKEAKLKSPCIIVVGDVVKFSEELNWYEQLPLHGVNICITRSRQQSSNLKVNLRELGAEVTEINSLKVIETTDSLEDKINELYKYKHIIFTSQNSVNIFFDYLVRKNVDVRNLKGDFYVVGKATNNALIKRGIVAKDMAREFVGEGLFKVIKPYINSGDNILIPCSKLSRNYLQDELQSLGANVDRVDIYEVLEGDGRNKKAFDEVDLVLFTSPSTLNNMISIVGIDKIREKLCVAIGPQTYKAMKEQGIVGMYCKKHSDEGFLEEVIDIVNKNIKRGECHD